jgi:hypothetical protein
LCGSSQWGTKAVFGTASGVQSGRKRKWCGGDWQTGGYPTWVPVFLSASKKRSSVAQSEISGLSFESGLAGCADPNQTEHWQIVTVEDEGGMLAEGGTVRQGPLLETATVTPPAGAGLLIVIVHVLVESA